MHRVKYPILMQDTRQVMQSQLHWVIVSVAGTGLRGWV
jgi:hypothetical protein